MRRLAFVVAVLAALYGGYWFVGRAQVEKLLTNAAAEINASNVEFSYQSLRTRGFPSRFDTTITDLVFADPANALRWEAPFFQLFALAYRPNEVIAVFGNEQTVTIDGETFTLFTRDMRASGKVRANTVLSFLNTTVTMDNPRLRTTEGAELAMASLLAAARLTPDTDESYDIYLEARSIVLPEHMRTLLDPDELLPALIQGIRLDTTASFDLPIELNGEAGRPSRLETLTIKEIGIDWGDMAISAIGDIETDAAGFAIGTVTLSARNWQQALDIMTAAGLIEADIAMTYRNLASGMDETPHIPDTLTVTLVLSGGQMRLGPLPLGPAPRF